MPSLQRCLVLALAASLASSAAAQEITLANDSTLNGVPSVAGATTASFARRSDVKCAVPVPTLRDATRPAPLACLLLAGAFGMGWLRHRR